MRRVAESRGTGRSSRGPAKPYGRRGDWRELFRRAIGRPGRRGRRRADRGSRPSWRRGRVDLVNGPSRGLLAGAPLLLGRAHRGVHLAGLELLVPKASGSESALGHRLGHQVPSWPPLASRPSRHVRRLVRRVQPPALPSCNSACAGRCPPQVWVIPHFRRRPSRPAAAAVLRWSGTRSPARRPRRPVRRRR